MPYFRNKHILLIHIPKTGGTTVELLFSKNDTMELYSDVTNTLLPANYQNTSLQHQFYTTIYNYRNICNINFDSKLNVISIVRNPYNRIISDLFWNNLINKESTKAQVYQIITTYLISTDYDNHNVPQYKFVTDDNGQLFNNISIFKTETLNDDIKLMGYDITENANVAVPYAYISYLNNDSICLINSFYNLDFELFNYEKITPV